MITLYDGPVMLRGGFPVPDGADAADKNAGSDGAGVRGGGALSGAGGGMRGMHGKAGTMAHRILAAHNAGSDDRRLNIRFDALVSHDITYVGIIQTAKASGMTRFDIPYALTNCHNSLCAVGGTINGDDHAFGLSAAVKYGGIYVPANFAVIHQYAREALCESGAMILGSDSHTRYGPLGVMGVGEGGPELVKQLLGNSYDVNMPEVVLVWLENAPPRGVGPHDIAISLCGAVYDNGFAKNKVLEFAGPGLGSLPMDYRFGIDVMTTETACLSSIWQSDDRAVSRYYESHGKKDVYKPLAPEEGARYDSMIKIDLAKAESMIAAPFHPSKAFTIKEMNANAGDILREIEKEAAAQFGAKVRLQLADKAESGRIRTDQGIIAGCAGGMYDNIREAASILERSAVGNGFFTLSIYPSSAPVNLRLINDGVAGRLTAAGAIFKPCFCGPCFGAGDVPANNGFSVRHATRNFINREGSRPADGQLAVTALMDARSIAATAGNGGLLTSAAELDYEVAPPSDDAHAVLNSLEIYKKRVYNGFGKPAADVPLKYGPNIADWPKIEPLGENMLLCVASVINDPVTTTDELIPSGETSSYRSNPIKLSEFALSRRDPGYVARAKAIRELGGGRPFPRENAGARNALAAAVEFINAGRGERIDAAELAAKTQIASTIFARKPGDGSAREQAASCQRVLGGGANISHDYATKRYRSNLINWGMLPFAIAPEADFDPHIGDWIFVPDVRERIEAYRAATADDRSGLEFPALHIGADGGCGKALTLRMDRLTDDECEIILSGCLMNYYANKKRGG